MDRNDPYLAQASAMPAMPEVAQQLLRSMDRDDLSLGEVAGLIARDPVIAAKVMRLANSARYAPSHNIDTLGDAAACLGLNTLRDLSLSAAMAGAFPHPPGFDRSGFWRQCLATGCYAQVLAKALDADADVAYLGGMMLRVGQLLMMMVDPEGMGSALQHAKEVDSLIGYEQAYIGRSHPEVTSQLARHWQFPASLCAAFLAATAPLEARPFNRLGAVLRLASVVAEAREAGQPAADALAQVQQPLVAHLRLDLDWLEAHLPDHRLASAGADQLLS